MKEIERKFLVRPGWRPGSRGVRIAQGYLSSAGETTVRVRIAGGAAFLTLKGPTRGFTRDEFEYPIPKKDAEALLELCPLKLEKRRHRVRHAGKLWEVDVFRKGKRRLIVAELELKSERERFEAPPWLGKEVSLDARYFNVNLARRWP